MQFTAVYIEAEDGWFVGYVEEVPGVHAQGRTIDETRESLREVLDMMLDANREDARKSFVGYRVALRERMRTKRP